MLCQIVESIMPLDYYQVMMGARIDQRISDHFLKEKLPNLYQHFQECCYDPSMTTLQWFTCLFAYNF